MDMMKIDAALIRQLREERAWPQEHLASVASLEPCTIQRVEADGSASAETPHGDRHGPGCRCAARLNLPTQARSEAPDPQPPTPSPATAAALPPAGSPRISRMQYRWLRFLVIAGLLVEGLDVYRAAPSLGRNGWC